MLTPAYTDKAKLFKNKNAIEARREQLSEPHIKPLTEYVDALRIKHANCIIPYFDPWDGGVNAECLFLLEAPGGAAVDFVSRNNDDETAKNFFILNQCAGIEREITISWNIVPWYIGSGNKIRPAKIEDISEGIPHLLDLLKLLPKLRVVVFIGQKAQRAEKFIRQYMLEVDLKSFNSPHPSPLFVNHDKPANWNKILAVLRDVSSYIKTAR